MLTASPEGFRGWPQQFLWRSDQFFANAFPEFHRAIIWTIPAKQKPRGVEPGTGGTLNVSRERNGYENRSGFDDG
jgi:hypothetical protein